MFDTESKDPLVRADLARWRTGLYRSASVAFLREPTDDELLALARSARAALSGQGSGVLACERVLLECLASYADGDAALAGTRVRSEYAELFVGPRPPLAPIYESIYRGSPRRLCTDTTRRVREEYERNGLAVAKRNRIPDDHLGYELEFMATICERQACAAEGGRADDEAASIEVQQRFLADHLVAWTALFLERVECADCGGYYRAWARFVAQFVAEDVRLARQCAQVIS